MVHMVAGVANTVCTVWMAAATLLGAPAHAQLRSVTHAEQSSFGRRVLMNGPSTPAEEQLLVRANQDREEHGLAPLNWDPLLAASARAHADLMARSGEISHQFEGEAGLTTRAARAGTHFSAVAENVAEAPDAATIHNGWMQSPPHRANLLDERMDGVGIAIVERDGELFAVEDFSRHVQSLNLEEQERKVGAEVASLGATYLADTPAARNSCAMENGYAGARRPTYVMHYTTSDLSRIPKELRQLIQNGRTHQVAVGACSVDPSDDFSYFSIAVLVY